MAEGGADFSLRGASAPPTCTRENFPCHKALIFVPVYRRRLPHIHQIGEPLFITWRLAGSLPENRPFRRADLTNGEAFDAFDRLLDTTRTGPQYLKEPALAGLVTEYLLRLAQRDDIYDLHAFAVMPNHVHALLTPSLPLAKVMQRVKGGQRGSPTKC